MNMLYFFLLNKVSITHKKKILEEYFLLEKFRSMGKICEIWNEHKVYCVANIRKSKEYHVHLKLMSKS